MTYADFLDSKRRVVTEHGCHVELDAVHPSLFDFQRAVTQWALRKGRCAVFADTGLGKTRMQVEWARLTGERTLILAPLAVAQQTVAEAIDIGVAVAYVRDQTEADSMMAAGCDIVITNYERLHKFDPSAFGAVVLDESSILKSFSGATKKALVKAFASTPYRLCCTATPAPNDLEELCNHADFLGVMKPAEMRSTFFIADSRGEFMRYRLKRHARDAFFRWLASWAIAVKRPSDLGFDDGPFELPGLSITPHYVSTDWRPDGVLFGDSAFGVSQQAQVRRDTMQDRVERVMEIVNGREAPGVQPQVGGGEPRARTDVQGSDQGLSQRSASRAVRGGTRSPSAGGGVGASESGQAATSTSGTDVWAHGRPAGADARPGMPDLRGEAGGRSDRSPDGGPLAPDGADEGSALPLVQPRVGSPAGRSARGRSGAGVPARTRDDQWIVWCGLNDEQDLIAKLLGDDCVSIDGRTDHDERVEIEQAWRRGDVRVMVTKPKVFGHGMNWQHCSKMVFCGLGYSYEQYYQSLRRCHRFGQTRPVEAHIVLSEPERNIYATVLDKERQAQELSGGLLAGMRDHTKAELFAGTSKGDTYEPRTALTLPAWMRESA